MSTSPVTLDFSKAQPLTLDFSKAQPLTGGGGPQPGAQPPQGTPPQGGAPGAAPHQSGGPISDLLFGEGNTWRDLIPSNPIPTLKHIVSNPGDYVREVAQRAKDAATGPLRGLATAEQNMGMTGGDQFLSDTAPKSQTQQENYGAGDQMAGILLTDGLARGLNMAQLAKSLKAAPVLEKLATENPHIARIIGSGLKAGVANAASTGILGGSVGDMANAGGTGAVLGSFAEAPNARADYQTEAATKYAPDVTDIGGKKFTTVSEAAREKGITTQEQEPGLQAQNRQAYEDLRDQGIRGRAAQGTAAAVNAMEPTQPKVSVAGAQKLKARTSASTAPPETPITDASPREIDTRQRFLQKVIDSKKFPQAVKDKAQTQLDRINTQVQAVTDFKNDPQNFRTDTPIDPKVLMQNSTNFGEFAEELNRQAERRTQDMQWHQRQYDTNGEVKLDALGNEVWKPVDMKSMSRTEQDASIADGDLAQRDVRGLSKVDVQQGQRLSRMAEAATQLDNETQAIYDLTRPRTESVQNQTNQPNLTQELRSTNLQGHIDKLEKLANGEFAPEFKDMFGRKDGITDLIAAAQKIGYADNGAKYSGTLGNYFMKTLTKRTSLSGKGATGAGLYVLGKLIGLKGSVATLGAEAAAEAAHRSFMHRIATDSTFANKVLTKDRSPITPLRITSSTLANLGTQSAVRDDVDKRVQGGDNASQEGID